MAGTAVSPSTPPCTTFVEYDLLVRESLMSSDPTSLNSLDGPAEVVLDGAAGAAAAVST
jgi:hypothetical protein